MIEKKNKLDRILLSVPPFSRSEERQELKTIIRIKDFFKKNQKMYAVIMSFIFPIKYSFYYSKKIFNYVSKDGIVLNLGSGNKIIDESVINVDFFPYPNIDILSDINKIPVKESSVDGIISEVTLEHLENPDQALSEMNRVMKPGGYLCISIPFIFYYHESPNDYHRWTKDGIKFMLKKNNFKIIEIENLGGPAGSFCLITAQLLAIALSFNSIWLYHFLTYFFLIVLSPIHLLDFLIGRFKMASNSAAIFLVIAQKISNN